MPEYVAWRVFDNALDWFRLKDGAYSRVEPDADRVIESAVFPGLRLNVTRLLAGDHAAAIGLAPAAPPAPTDGA